MVFTLSQPQTSSRGGWVDIPVSSPVANELHAWTYLDRIVLTFLSWTFQLNGATNRRTWTEAWYSSFCDHPRVDEISVSGQPWLGHWKAWSWLALSDIASCSSISGNILSKRFTGTSGVDSESENWAKNFRNLKIRTQVLGDCALLWIILPQNKN